MASLEVDRLAAVILRGKNLTGDLRDAVIGASLSIGTDEVTELSLTFVDPDLRIARTGLVTTDASVDLLDLRLLVSAVNLGPGPAGTGQIVADCRPRGIDKLKARRGALVMRRASPSTFVTVEGKAAGLTVVAEPTATRPQVSRDVPAAGESYGDDPPSSWTTIRRLADELGFLVFEVAGTLYFGRPTWLIAKLPSIRVGWLGEAEATRALSVPDVRRSKDGRNLVEGSVELPYSRLDEARPGRALALYGTPGYLGRYLITSVEAELAAVDEPITVSFASPVNPTPNPPDPTDGATKSPDGKTPNADVATFMRLLLAQVGDVYRLGVEVDLTADDPDAWDCSELVQWAAARCGVTFPDGSAAQLAACQKAGTMLRTVDAGLRQRGALLFHPGHVAISLGDGRVVEAANAKSGVTTNPGAGRFTSAALLPGLTY